MRRVVVIGAGPAGMAAAREAAAHGVEVVLIDAAAKLGGQYHRQDALEPGDRFGSPVAPGSAEAALPEVEHVADATVWAIEPIDGGHRVHLRIGPADGPSRQGRAVEARAIVLATGAYDRALPFPGWDLPGVVTVGAAQALAKGQGVAVGDRVVVGGTGPFLLPAAVSLIRAGARVVEVAEANAAVTGWLTSPRGALAGWSKSGELARYAAALVRRRVPYRSRTAVVEAHGSEVVESVTLARLDARWTPIPGSERRVQADAVAVGFGFTPQSELALATRCRVSDGFVVVDAAQGTTAPGVFAAGELTGIGGADLAAAEGAVAGAAAAKYVGAAVEPPLRAMARVRSGRRFAAALAAAYPVRAGWHDWLRDDTIVCRCEEITKAALFRAVDDRDVGAARSLKLVSGVGLGLCQGRVCGQNAAELAGVDGTGFAKRPIASPVRLAELAEEEPIESPIDAEESGSPLGVEY
ncbi:NAD(P)/FAD-dependent oxidoreductase [Glycomyces sp. TRM65418]|uniref:NAD(P)/FAD-dependent oxidoreductase n=1 Tax=Glycomyces sp. TRM65418 TaxID=2867006 RepID=UPI001CE6B856|nr:FAD/NAD(P)-binding oxidoreductase [Glycomyces sp. TRM65418]MCC3765281.1 NAD(P)/FAD-dependent oxidoreductase [Glycomyces sp. TRM65418]QZD54901.1 NAD(P)/FAD-dependent oxidoreductase [Glycomyces sp. TRM65418]